MRYASLRDGQPSQHVELKEAPEVMVLSYLISFRTVVQPAHDRFDIRFVCGGGHAPVLKRKHLLAHL
jgi:putative intracellular protease/amidase